jgi:hypothetical protein
MRHHTGSVFVRASWAFLISVITLTAMACSSKQSGEGGGLEPGCSTAPACASCESCFDACVCKGQSVDQCIANCSGGTGGGGGTAGSAGSSGGAGASGQGGDAGGAATEFFTIQTTPRAIAPGEEAFFCQNFANPFGQDVAVLESESFMTPGSHHMFVFYEPGAVDGPVKDCSGLEFKRPLHLAQSPQQKSSYPPGVGRVVSGADGLRVSAHYLNTGTSTIEAQISVVFKVVPKAAVVHQAGALFFNNLAIYVAPNGPGQATKTCTLPYDAKLINAVSHMHQYATSFVATASSGETIYETTDWDEPVPKLFEPPLALAAGTQITFTCSYQNNTGSALTFGDSAKHNEMCILAGAYYPAPDGAGIECIF